MSSYIYLLLILLPLVATLGLGGVERLRGRGESARWVCRRVFWVTAAGLGFGAAVHLTFGLSFWPYLLSTVLSLGFWLLAAVAVLMPAQVDEGPEVGFTATRDC